MHALVPNKRVQCTRTMTLPYVIQSFARQVPPSMGGEPATQAMSTRPSVSYTSSPAQLGPGTVGEYAVILFHLAVKLLGGMS